MPIIANYLYGSFVLDLKVSNILNRGARRNRREEITKGFCLFVAVKGQGYVQIFCIQVLLYK